jgi:hypothetical protein
MTGSPRYSPAQRIRIGLSIWTYVGHRGWCLVTEDGWPMMDGMTLLQPLYFGSEGAAQAFLENLATGKQSSKSRLSHVTENTYGVSPSKHVVSSPWVSCADASLRCHVCGALAEKTYTLEHFYENEEYRCRQIRFSGIGLCEGCVPRGLSHITEEKKEPHG